MNCRLFFSPFNNIHIKNITNFIHLGTERIDRMKENDKLRKKSCLKNLKARKASQNWIFFKFFLLNRIFIE